jgi:predicted Rossmann fold flavoprotein
LNKKIIIVGGGPAGMFAAATAANKTVDVLLLEKMPSLGRKLLLTGKGRCNITNNDNIADFITQIYPNGKFLRTAFNHFFSEDIIQLFKENGLEVKLERGGRYFPVTDRSVDVLRVFEGMLNKHAVQINLNTEVEHFVVEDNKIKGIISQGKFHTADAVILATGGKSYPTTGSTGEIFDLIAQLGHSIVPLRQALVPLQTKEKPDKKMQELKLKNCRASLFVDDKKLADEFGELEFLPYGLSGAIILKLSRHITAEMEHSCNINLQIDLKAALDEKKLDNRLLRDFDANGKKQLSTLMKEYLPSAIIPFFLKKLDISPDILLNQINAKQRKRIGFLLKNIKFEIEKLRPFEEAIITAGGVSHKEISAKTMESKIISGLYFAGEILDLYADTGGYNLQIAYSTASLAANSCVRKLQNEE